MKTEQMITRFIEYCKVFRNLSPETQRAYASDLHQFELSATNSIIQCSHQKQLRSG